MTISKQKHPWSRGENAILIAVAIGIIAIVGIVIGFARRDFDPVVSIPSRAAPNPNAYDYFLRASQSAVEGWPMPGSLSPSAGSAASIANYNFPQRFADGAYPASLSQLVPSYLHSVPIDPFTPSSMPLLYRLNGAKYILYSIGPDMHDDGGTPISDKTRRDILDKNAPYAVWPNSHGDIVAGVNL
jgi:hypothetical protein